MQGRIEDIARESFHELMYSTGMGLEDDPQREGEVILTNIASYKCRDEGHKDYEEKGENECKGNKIIMHAHRGRSRMCPFDLGRG